MCKENNSQMFTILIVRKYLVLALCTKDNTILNILCVLQFIRLPWFWILTLLKQQKRLSHKLRLKDFVNKSNMKKQCDFLFIVNYMLADWEDSSMFMSLWLCWSDRVYICSISELHSPEVSMRRNTAQVM